MKLNFDFSPWISPVTGHMLFPPFPLEKDYIWVGDRDNIAQPSPALIDVRLDIVDVRHRIDALKKPTYILQTPTPLFPNAQALSDLAPGGLLKSNQDGVISIAYLNQGQVFVGDANNQPQSVQTISIDNLPNLTFKRIWRGNILSRPSESDDLTTLETEVEEIQVKLGDLELEITELQTAVTELQNWQIAAEAQIEEMLLEIGTLQVEVAALQSEVAAIQAELVVINGEIAALQAELAALGITVAELGATVAGLSATVTALGFTVAGLGITVASHSFQISSLQSSVSSLQQQIDNLSLDTLPCYGDVSLSGHKLINVGDPILPTDGANKQYVDGKLITVVGAVTGIGTLGTAVATVFSPDPVFTGKSMAMPSGDSSQRPAMLIPGMIRFNTSL
jgi:prefoldin subunit 5